MCCEHLMLRYITEKIPIQFGAKACTHSLTGHVLCIDCSLLEFHIFSDSYTMSYRHSGIFFFFFFVRKLSIAAFFNFIFLVILIPQVTCIQWCFYMQIIDCSFLEFYIFNDSYNTSYMYPVIFLFCFCTLIIDCSFFKFQGLLYHELHVPSDIFLAFMHNFLIAAF